MVNIEKLRLSFFLESLNMLILEVLLFFGWKFHWWTWLLSIDNLRRIAL